MTPRTAFRALAAALLAATLSVPAFGQGASAPKLFGPTRAAAATVPDKPTTVRSRVVAPDLAAVAALARDHVASGRAARFTLDLFDGLDLEAEVIGAEVRATGSTVYARLVDVELGTAVLTYEGGLLGAAVSFPGGTYAVEPLVGGAYRVEQVATQLMAPELPPRPHLGGAPAASAFDALPDVPADSGRLIDVMIVWTPAAESAGGGASAMQLLAQQSVDHSNLVYLNSGVAQRLRLVHRQQVTYTETTSCGATAFDCALDAITDGNIPNVHALRDTHGADLVSLFINNSAYCGLAWLPLPSSGTAGQGYSILYWSSCPVQNKSFVHELGHNMGAHHDPYVVGTGSNPCGDGKAPGAYCFSRGYVHIGASNADSWRTVLAYVNQCTASGVGNCQRVDFLSNPKLRYNNIVLGTAAYNNNAHTLNKTAKAIAAYRPTSALHPVPQRFTDVATNSTFYGHIEFLAQAGVTGGCTGTQYCPNTLVTRRQMAVFLERVMRASNWAPPAPTGIFSDVPPGAQFRDYIEALFNDGITTGCGAGIYCPDAGVTRGQMAAFLLRARCGAAYVPGTPASQVFADVPPSYAFYKYVDKLYRLGITGGCASGPLRYCPNDGVTRAAMAAFIERNFPLSTPTETCTP